MLDFLISDLRVFANHAVNQKVRITANWAGKVGIILCCQTIMPMIVFWIAGLLHRTQQHHVQNVCTWLIFHLSHEFLQGLLGDFIGRPMNVNAKNTCIIKEFLQFLCFRLFVNTIDKRQFAFWEMFCYGFIGCQHERLNHAFSYTTLTQDDIHRHPFIIDDNFCLIGIKIQSPTTHTHFLQNGVQISHVVNRFNNRLVFFCQFVIPSKDSIDITISHAESGVNHWLANLVIDHTTLAIDFHQTRLRQTVHIWIEGTNSIWQTLRQHRYHTARYINSSATRHCLTV